jgi:hypothetical protein
MVVDQLLPPVTVIGHELKDLSIERVKRVAHLESFYLTVQ